MTMMNDIPWWKKAVVYQVYPKSFKDSNGDGFGDIPGIIQKLDYLENLGVDVIWLNPIYRSPQVDNGYDIANYRSIDPIFGTMNDFISLLKAVHRRGMRLIMDLVVNHTSDQHPWFKAAQQSRTDPHHDYYIWQNGENNQLPNNWGSSFGGSAWTYDQNVAQYYLHLFAKQQPDLNWDNPQVRHEVYALMKFWLDKGVDGFRMDVISLISKKPDYPDGPVVYGKKYGSYYDGAANGPKVHDYLQEMNREVLSHYDVLTVGETPHTDAAQAGLYTGTDRHELDMVFQFDHMHLDYGKYGKFSTKRFKLTDLKATMTRWQVAMAKSGGWNSLYWSNHDQPRAVTRFGNDGKYRKRSAKMLGTILHMMQGTPYIFEGEELGLKNVRFYDIASYQDLETKNMYRELIKEHGETATQAMEAIYLHSRDNARTPMPWSAETKGGFTTGRPWLALNPDHDSVNVDSDLNSTDSVYHYYQRLVRLRHEEPVITTGRYELLDAKNDDTFTFLRRSREATLLVAGNFTAEARNVQVPDELHQLGSKLLISNFDANDESGDTVTLPAYGTVVYKFED